MPSLTARDIADILEIEALKARFFESVDRCVSEPDRSRAGLRAMLVEEVEADYGAFGVPRGREAFIDFLIGAYAKFDWLWHSAHSPRVEVNGDNAVGYWTSDGQARLKESGMLVASINRYRDDFVRTADGWRFAVVRDILEARKAGDVWDFLGTTDPASS